MAGLVQQALTRFHTGVLRLSRGRVAARVGKAPVLLLATSGRRSGKRRTVPLLYVDDDGGYAVIASNGGAPKHPAWFLNLRARPEAEVELGGRTTAVRAEEASGDERERLWRKLTAVYSSYDTYQTRTDRKIPVVRLRPL